MNNEAPDNMDYRMALMDRVRSGQITFQDAQAELRAVQNQAQTEGRETYYGSGSNFDYEQ